LTINKKNQSTDNGVNGLTWMWQCGWFSSKKLTDIPKYKGMKHLCIPDQFSIDYRYSLQENLYTPLHIFAMPTAAQGLQMTDPMSVCCSCSIQN